MGVCVSCMDLGLDYSETCVCVILAQNYFKMRIHLKNVYSFEERKSMIQPISMIKIVVGVCLSVVWNWVLITLKPVSARFWLIIIIKMCIHLKNMYSFEERKYMIEIMCQEYVAVAEACS